MPRTKLTPKAKRSRSNGSDEPKKKRRKVTTTTVQKNDDIKFNQGKKMDNNKLMSLCFSDKTNNIMQFHQAMRAKIFNSVQCYVNRSEIQSELFRNVIDCLNKVKPQAEYEQNNFLSNDNIQIKKKFWQKYAYLCLMTQNVQNCIKLKIAIKPELIVTNEFNYHLFTQQYEKLLDIIDKYHNLKENDQQLKFNYLLIECTEIEIQDVPLDMMPVDHQLDNDNNKYDDCINKDLYHTSNVCTCTWSIYTGDWQNFDVEASKQIDEELRKQWQAINKTTIVFPLNKGPWLSQTNNAAVHFCKVQLNSSKTKIIRVTQQNIKTGSEREMKRTPSFEMYQYNNNNTNKYKATDSKQWNCSFCTLVNSSTLSKCAMCNHDKPDSGHKQSSVSNLKNFDCMICLESKSIEYKHIISHCGHIFCRDCLRGHILNYNKPELPDCPLPKCNAKMADHIDIQVLITEKEYRQLHEKMDKIGISKLKYLKQCLTPDCKYAIELIDGIRLNCPVCKKNWCTECQVEWHSGITCGDYKKQEMDKEIKEYNKWKESKSDVIKACPSCHNDVEKNGGCNHMRCICGSHWCWVCGVAIDGNNVEGHFNQNHPIFRLSDVLNV